MNENPSCTECPLSITAHSVCLKGRGWDDAKLVVFMDSPNFVEDRRGVGMVSEGAEWVRWAFRRMSIEDGYFMEYTLKCSTKRDKSFGKKHYRSTCIDSCSAYRIATLQLFRPKAIVAMGAVSCQMVTGKDKVSLHEGTTWTPVDPEMRDFIDHVWVTYSPLYVLEAPAESVGIFRVLWHAAIEAGLNPVINPDVKPFDYGT